MSDASASVVLWIAAAYAVPGLLFAVAFVACGVQRIDPGARSTGIAFRLLILPGSLALWPLLLARWLAGATAPPAERNAHDRAAEARP